MISYSVHVTVVYKTFKQFVVYSNIWRATHMWKCLQALNVAIRH